MSLSTIKQDFDTEVISCEEISDFAMLEKFPLVSVNMITYNHEHYISEAIKGVLMQEIDFPIELVISEDCSTDRTCEIIIDYQKKYPEVIRLIISEKNVGMMKNFIRTEKACRGEYMAYCEGDDFWHDPLKLQKQVDYLKSHQDVGMVHSNVDWHFVDKNKTIRNRYRCIANSDLIRGGAFLERDILLLKYKVSTCTVIVRREIIDEILKECRYEFSDEFPMGDMQTWLELARRTKIAYINESMATYNYLSESACRSKNIERQIMLFKNSEKLYRYYGKKWDLENSGNLSTLLERRYVRGLLTHAFTFHRSGLAKEAHCYAKKQNVAWNLLDKIYYIGAQNIAIFFFVRCVFLPVSLLRKFIKILTYESLAKLSSSKKHNNVL